MKNESIWSPIEYDAFLASIETVASKFEHDFASLQHGEISKQEFDKKYGHLRAGTYDIRKPRYDSMNFAPPAINSQSAAQINKTLMPYTPHLLKIPSEFGITSEQLHSFMKLALEQREFFKFEFTKALSFVLELVAKIAELLGFSRNDMSYFDINEIVSLSIYGTDAEIKDYIAKALPLRKNERKLLSKLILPNVLTKPQDFDFIQRTSARPNFITEKSIRAKTVSLDEENMLDVRGKIVIIEKADPGYDWIFTKGIAALVTCYGGVASHMAIRCAEFEIPAAIGCGQKIYSFAQKSAALELDCKHGKIRSVEL